jgi:hypothetical protein
MTDDDADREARIEALKHHAASLAGGPMVAHESDELPPDAREEFWRRVVEFETGETTDLTTELRRVGIELPEPEALDDEALHANLWVAINALADMNVFLYQTNHLSDRALYTLLYRELLPEEMDALNPDDGSAWHINILGGGSLDDVNNYLRYYADPTTRQFFEKKYPDEPLPVHEDPPYDRDRLLPTYWT